jgi:hypothetical protein
VKEMTDEEADALDEYYTKNPPKVDPGKNGGFAKHSGHIVIVNDITATYLRARADAVHKTPSEIVDEMVKEHIGAAAG